MAMETTDITVEILWRIQAEQAAHRLETRAIQQSFVDLARVVQRLDARLSDVKEDLETMFKMEIIGQQAHLETRLEARFDAMFSESEARLEARLDTKLADVVKVLSDRFDNAFSTLSDRLDRIEQRLPG